MVGSSFWRSTYYTQPTVAKSGARRTLKAQIFGCNQLATKYDFMNDKQI